MPRRLEGVAETAREAVQDLGRGSGTPIANGRCQPPRSECTRARVHGSPPAADTAGAPHALGTGASGRGLNLSQGPRALAACPSHDVPGAAPAGPTA